MMPSSRLEPRDVRRTPAAALALALLLVFTGCAAIPTSGAVTTETIDPPGDDGQIVERPERPQPGASMAEILLGFIRAGRAPQNDYSVAREYLAENVEWNPIARVLVSATVLQPVAIEDDTLALTVGVSAEVDQHGRYLSTSATHELVYRFVQEDGEYRLASVPPGTLVPPNRFAATFDAYPLYFFDPSLQYLVPDLRWFPNAQAARRIVTELVEDPSPWLASGVLVSAFPDGVEPRIEIPAPEIRIDLSAEAGGETAATQRRMVQQLERSLAAVRNISQVTVTVAGIPLSRPDGGGGAEFNLTVRDTPFGGVDGTIRALTPSGADPLPVVGTRADGLGAVGASLSRDRRSLAVLGPAGVTLVPPQGDPVAIDERPNLLPPAIDPHGWVWTVPADSPAALQAATAQQGPQLIPLDAEGRIVALEVARDGARLLVALETPSGPRLLVYGILRDADLMPVGLGTPLSLAVGEQLVDAAWVDGDTVVLIQRDADGSTDVVLRPLGGPTTNLGEAGNAVAVVGGNGENGVRVLTADGRVLRPSGVVDWVDTGLRASFLGTQQ